VRILITGATGYLGQAIAGVLVERGEEVVALVRASSRPAALPPGVRVVRGDVLDPDSLEAAMTGCSCVIHLAGVVKMWLRDRAEFHRVNVQGLETAMAVAERLRINRFLYASSIVALGPTDGAVLDETHFHRGDHFHTEYERTKVFADRVALERAAGGFPILLLYPGVLYGPGPITEGNLMYRVVRECLEGKFRGQLGRGDRRICYSYLADVARGFHRALRHGRRGERYILGGPNATFVEFLDCLEEVAGIAIRRRKIPFWVAQSIGRLQRWRARWFGIPPDLTDGVVRVYRHEWAYSSRKAEQELGYRVTALRDGLRLTVEWLRARQGATADGG
jgi:farnesol dehydrogenase